MHRDLDRLLRPSCQKITEGKIARALAVAAHIRGWRDLFRGDGLHGVGADQRPAGPVAALDDDHVVAEADNSASKTSALMLDQHLLLLLREVEKQPSQRGDVLFHEPSGISDPTLTDGPIPSIGIHELAEAAIEVDPFLGRVDGIPLGRQGPRR